MTKEKKVVAVLPAYNAAKTLKMTLDDIPRDYVDDIILVDDFSSDNTYELAKQLGIKAFRHEKNLGYGGNQKTCYQEALKEGADIVVMVHPDHQYDPKYIPQIIEPLLNDECDAVFGSRMKEAGKAREGGMPYWKYCANIFLTKLENWVLGQNLTEYHSGFRAYSKKVISDLPIGKNSDDFVFDTQIIIQMILAGFKIQEISINTRYFKDASSISLKRSIEYGLGILKNLVKYKLQKSGVKKYEEYDVAGSN